MSGGHQMLLGGAGAGALINAQGASAFDSAISPSNPSCAVSFNSSGTCTKTGDSGHTTFTWLLGGSAASYDIRFQGTVTGIGGTVGGVTLGTWYNLGSTRSINFTKTSGIGVSDFNGTYDIALTTTATPIKSGSISLGVSRDS